MELLTFNAGGVLFSSRPEMHFHVEIQRQQKNCPVQHRIEYPRVDSVTTTLDQVQQEHPDVAQQIAPQQNYLTVHHEREARARQPNRRPESVPVNDGVYGSRHEDGQDLE